MAHQFHVVSAPAPAGSFWSARRNFLTRCRPTLVALALAAAGLPAIAAEPSPELFLLEKTGHRALQADQASPGREAVRFNRALSSLPPGSEARFSLTRGVSYELIFDHSMDHPSGNVTWVGHLKGYGDDYRAIITSGEGGVSGRILTPEGEFLVETDADGEWLVDTQAAGWMPAEPEMDDALIPVPENLQKHLPGMGPDTESDDEPSTGDAPQKDPLSDQLDPGDQAQVAADTTPATIDVMILYTPGLASRLGGGLSARLDQLVALSNQAYRDSGVYINLRLVHKQQVSYSDATTNDAALNALTNGSDPTLANVASLRNTYGADLVSLIRPFNKTASGGSCGVAWVGGSGGRAMSGYASYGYSVISDGTDVNGSNYYCLDLTFTHELGHNMGSMHDRANSGGGSGAYPYSYGHGVSGTFGTVMSYISPRIAKFSNPAITCANGIACGVSETAANSANNALSLNNTRVAVANFRTAQSTTPPPPTTTTYTLTVAKSGNGAVTSTPAGINCGTDCSEPYASGASVSLKATPASGSVFSGWSGACTGTATTCTVAMSAAKSVTATFKAQTASTYTLTVVKSGNGAVTSTPAGINCGTDCSEPYASGASVSLKATPASGSVFSGWSGACTGTATTCTVAMSAAKSVTATFKAQTASTYTLTVVKSGNGTVTSTPAGINCGTVCSYNFASGTSVTLRAVPAAGYTFGGSSSSCTGSVCTAYVTFRRL